MSIELSCKKLAKSLTYKLCQFPKSVNSSFQLKGENMNILIGYDRCSTCKKAEDFLKAEGVSFQKRPIKEEKLSAKEIHEIRERSGLPLKRFFNTSGLVYKAMELKDKLPSMTEEEQEALLATDGMLVKRPIFLYGEKVLVGFKEKEWGEAMK